MSDKIGLERTNELLEILIDVMDKSNGWSRSQVEATEAVARNILKAAHQVIDREY